MNFESELFRIETGSATPNRRYAKELDRLKYKSERAIRGLSEPAGVIGAINKLLFEENGFQYVKNGTYPFFHQTLTTHQGNCYSLSMLYLAIAEALGLPLHGVNMRDHVFVRWSDNGNRINIETTCNGREISDADYYFDNDVHPTSIENLVYMVNTTPEQFLANAFDRMGAEAQENGNLKKSIALFEEATRLDPAFSSGYHNSGTSFLEMGNVPNAIEAQSKAIDLDPLYWAAFEERANAFYRINEVHRAAQDYRTAMDTMEARPYVSDHEKRMMSASQRRIRNILSNIKKTHNQLT